MDRCRTTLLAGVMAAGCTRVTPPVNSPSDTDNRQDAIADESGETATTRPPAEPDQAAASAVDREAIDIEVRGRLADIRACYDTRAAADPQLQGVVVARFMIDDAGLARGIELSSRDFEDPELNGCLHGILQSMQFPPSPHGEQVVVTYPFDFRAE